MEKSGLIDISEVRGDKWRMRCKKDHTYIRINYDLQQATAPFNCDYCGPIHEIYDAKTGKQIAHPKRNTMSNKRKGSKNERKAMQAYESAGYSVYNPPNNQYGDTDAWGLFDLLAWMPGNDLRLLQVKTNEATGINGWMARARKFEQTLDGVVPEFLVRHDGKGWRVARPVDGGYEWVCDTRDGPHNIDDGLERWLQKTV